MFHKYSLELCSLAVHLLSPLEECQIAVTFLGVLGSVSFMIPTVTLRTLLRVLLRNETDSTVWDGIRKRLRARRRRLVFSLN